MASMQFRSSDPKKPKLYNFDSSPDYTLKKLYGYHSIELRDPRPVGYGTVYDVNGKQTADSKWFKFGELIHSQYDWPGGPVYNR